MSGAAPAAAPHLRRSGGWEELFPWPARAHAVAGGWHLAYLDEGGRPGDGRPVVLCVHGNPTWSFLWRDVVAALAPGRRVVAPDHIGMGRSDRPSRSAYPYRLARRIDDLESLWRALGSPPLDLVVHDWGGAIGLGLAGRHPGSVRRLVITNTAAFADRRLPRRIAVCRWPVLGPLVVRGLNGFAGPAVRMATTRRGGLPPAVAAGFLAPYRTWRDRVGIDAFVRDIPMEPDHPSRAALADVEAGLERLRDKPALLLWGGRDFCFHDGFLARWREILPAAEVVRLPDAGHYVLEDGGPAAVARIVAFLDQA